MDNVVNKSVMFCKTAGCKEYFVLSANRSNTYFIKTSNSPVRLIIQCILIADSSVQNRPRHIQHTAQKNAPRHQPLRQRVILIARMCFEEWISPLHHMILGDVHGIGECVGTVCDARHRLHVRSFCRKYLTENVESVFDGIRSLRRRVW